MASMIQPLQKAPILKNLTRAFFSCTMILKGLRVQYNFFCSCIGREPIWNGDPGPAERMWVRFFIYGVAPAPNYSWLSRSFRLAQIRPYYSTITRSVIYLGNISQRSTDHGPERNRTNPLGCHLRWRLRDRWFTYADDFQFSGPVPEPISGSE